MSLRILGEGGFPGPQATRSACVDVSRYVHPEFGWICPEPRLRRDVRVASYSLVCGAVIGAAAVCVLTVSDHGGSSQFAASPVETPVIAGMAPAPSRDSSGQEVRQPASASVTSNQPAETGPGRASPAPTGTRGAGKREPGAEKTCGDESSRSQQCLAQALEGRSPPAIKAPLEMKAPPAGNAPPIARVLLGAPAPSKEATAIEARAESPAEAPEISIPLRAAETPATSRPIREDGRSGAAQIAPLSNPEPRVTAPAHNRRPPVERAARVAPGETSRAYARDTGAARVGFWDWSR
jgi:hypothetical protein